jgi:hypothetical protein
MEWQPIETAPNDETILVAYDDGTVEVIDADDNDYEWEAYKGRRGGIIAPTHWMHPPVAPVQP